MPNESVKKREENRGTSIRDYVPLIVIVVLTAVAIVEYLGMAAMAGMMLLMTSS